VLAASPSKQDKLMPSANDGHEIRRRLMHTRSVECEGYLRDDGLWEVEAWLRDKKQRADRFRGELKPGDPVHDIGLQLAIDDGMTIRDGGSDDAGNALPHLRRGRADP
jgi:Protein of unknown function (DUF2889)